MKMRSCMDSCKLFTRIATITWKTLILNTITQDVFLDEIFSLKLSFYHRNGYVRISKAFTYDSHKILNDAHNKCN